MEVENGVRKKLFREAFKGSKTIRFDTCMRMISVPRSRVENTHHKSIRSLTRMLEDPHLHYLKSGGIQRTRGDTARVTAIFGSQLTQCPDAFSKDYRV